MQTALVVTLGQLLAMSPVLLVYLGGIILAAIWWRRAPRPAMLALTGLALMLLVTLAGATFQNYLIFNNPGRGSAIGQLMMAISFIRSLMHAGGLVLLVAAVFVGRSREQAGGFDLTPLPYAGRAEG